MNLISNIFNKKVVNIFDDKGFAVGYKKQITIPTINKRMIALMIDLLVPCIIYYFAIQFLYKSNIIDFSDQGDVVREAMIKNLENLKNNKSASASYNMPSLKSALLGILINYFLMGIYIVFFWYKFSASPGKIIMRAKIVNYKDISKPSLKSLIIRYLCYPICIFSIFSIMFSNKKRLLHDVISGTIVISA